MYDEVDWYEVLRVYPDATDDEIEWAWRQKVREAHPDKNGSPDATERTKLLNMARDILLDKDRRREFDRRRAERERQEEARRASANIRREQAYRNKIKELEMELNNLRTEHSLQWFELWETERKLRNAERRLASEQFIRPLYPDDKEKRRADQAEARLEQALRQVNELEEILEDSLQHIRNYELVMVQHGVIDVSEMYEPRPYEQHYGNFNADRERTSWQDLAQIRKWLDLGLDLDLLYD